jgi:hypothetical protein
MPLNVIAVPVRDIVKTARKQHAQPQPKEPHAKVPSSPPRIPETEPKWSSAISPGLWRKLREAHDADEKRSASPTSKGKGRAGLSSGSPSTKDEDELATERPPLLLKWSPRESYSHSVLYVRAPTSIESGDSRPADNTSDPAADQDVAGKSSSRRPPRQPKAAPSAKEPALVGAAKASPSIEEAHVTHPPLIPRPPMGSVRMPPGDEAPRASPPVRLESTGTNILPVAPREGSAKSRGDGSGSGSIRTGSARPWVRQQVAKSLADLQRLDLRNSERLPQAHVPGDVTRRLWTASSEKRLKGASAPQPCGRCESARQQHEKELCRAVDMLDCRSPREYGLNQMRLHDRTVRQLSNARPNTNGLDSVSLIEMPSVVTNVIVASTYAKPHRETPAVWSPRAARKTTGGADQLGKPDNLVQLTLQEYKRSVKAAAGASRD